MRLLYVDVAARAINPTATLMPLLIRAAVPDAMFYGPGYTARETLGRGILRFVDGNGPFDAVVFGPHVPLLSVGARAAEGMLDYLRRFTVLPSLGPELGAFLTDIDANAGRVDTGLRIASLLNYDYYATTPAQMERLEALRLHVLGPNRQFVSSIGELPDFAREERHFRRKAARLSDSFADFVAARPERVLTAVHFVGEAEFAFRALDARASEIAVPGAEYVLRARAMQALRRSGLGMAPKRIFALFRILRRLGAPVFSRSLPQRVYQQSFFDSLADTRFVFTARGGFGIPVRKFFEIPAAGAVMLCTPPVGFAGLGFRNGETHVEVEPEGLPDIVADLRRDPARAARIAVQGQEACFARHSLIQRASQFRACLDRLRAGTYAGADWIDGRFALREAA